MFVRGWGGGVDDLFLIFISIYQQLLFKCSFTSMAYNPWLNIGYFNFSKDYGSFGCVGGEVLLLRPCNVTLVENVDYYIGTRCDEYAIIL